MRSQKGFLADKYNLVLAVLLIAVVAGVIVFANPTPTGLELKPGGDIGTLGAPGTGISFSSLTHSPSSPTTLDNVMITATAVSGTSTVTIAEIQIYVDGSYKHSCTSTSTTLVCSSISVPYLAGSHSYYAKARGSNGVVVTSSTKSFTVSTVSQTMTLSAGTPTATTIPISWTAQSGFNASKGDTYIIYVNGIFKKTSITTSAIVDGLAPSTTYSIYVLAISGTTKSTMGKSNTISFSTIAQLYALTVSKSGTGSGTVTGAGINCGSDCSENYNSGTSVTLTASAASGSTFGGWSGACTGTSTSCAVSMNAAKTVTATFSNTPPTISVYVTTGLTSVEGKLVQKVSITASTTDNDITEIKIYVDGSLAKACTIPPYISPCSTPLQTYSAGPHTYYVTAKDKAGNQGRDPLSGTKSFVGLGWASVQNTGLTYESLRAVKFVDKTIGWAVGSEGVIIKTTDGGLHWGKQVSGTNSLFNDVYFINANTGWTVGSGGTILNTLDGGKTWTKQNSGGTSYLNAIYFINANTGWIVGYDDTILKTTNGGATWIKQSIGNALGVHTPLPFYDVYFVDANTGWVVGPLGSFLKTTDGGTTWANHNTQVGGSSLNHISFISPNTGWVVGNFPGVIKTTDGGATWTYYDNGFASNLNSVHFVDAYTGWTVGYGGQIFKTTDGGLIWIVDGWDLPYYTLHDIYFVSSTSGWAVGDGATILKYY